MADSSLAPASTAGVPDTQTIQGADRCVPIGICGGWHSAPARAETAIDLDGLTAAQAAAELCAGKITSKALTSAALARAKANPELNAFVTLDEPAAIMAAEAF